MEVIDMVRHKVYNLTINDFDMKMGIDEAESVIKNYCNLQSIPSELFFVWSNIACDILRANHSSAATTEAIPSNEVGSITVGDISITRASNLSSHKVNLDDLVLDYKNALNRFRKTRW